MLDAIFPLDRVCRRQEFSRWLLPDDVRVRSGLDVIGWIGETSLKLPEQTGSVESGQPALQITTERFGIDPLPREHRIEPYPPPLTRRAHQARGGRCLFSSSLANWFRWTSSG